MYFNTDVKHILKKFQFAGNEQKMNKDLLFIIIADTTHCSDIFFKSICFKGKRLILAWAFATMGNCIRNYYPNCQTNPSLITSMLRRFAFYQKKIT